MCISSSVLLPIRLCATVLPTCRRHRCILYGILTSLGYPLAFLLAMWKEHKKTLMEKLLKLRPSIFFRRTIVRHYYGNFNFLYTSFKQLQDRKPDRNHEEGGQKTLMEKLLKPRPSMQVYSSFPADRRI